MSYFSAQLRKLPCLFIHYIYHLVGRYNGHKIWPYCGWSVSDCALCISTLRFRNKTNKPISLVCLACFNCSFILIVHNCSFVISSQAEFESNLWISPPNVEALLISNQKKNETHVLNVSVNNRIFERWEHEPRLILNYIFYPRSIQTFLRSETKSSFPPGPPLQVILLSRPWYDMW